MDTMNTYQPKDPAIYEEPHTGVNTQDVMTYLLKQNAALHAKVRDLEDLHDGRKIHGIQPTFELDGRPVPTTRKALPAMPEDHTPSPSEIHAKVHGDAIADGKETCEGCGERITAAERGQGRIGESRVDTITRLATEKRQAKMRLESET